MTVDEEKILIGNIYTYFLSYCNLVTHLNIKLTVPNILHILLCLDFWDTAGQEKFQSMHPSYYHQAHACILVFDATRKNTYKNLSNWYDEMRKYRPSIPCICAVNKIDGG